mmetsp:Transcript_36948/g.94287  ORF Transcript_36948/g.94287 Transcript_36948/m.94287 type:complete len:256 (+) Transcript_36948:262-1029(+)
MPIRMASAVGVVVPVAVAMGLVAMLVLSIMAVRVVTERVILVVVVDHVPMRRRAPVLMSVPVGVARRPAHQWPNELPIGAEDPTHFSHVHAEAVRQTGADDALLEALLRGVQALLEILGSDGANQIRRQLFEMHDPTVPLVLHKARKHEDQTGDREPIVGREMLLRDACQRREEEQGRARQQDRVRESVHERAGDLDEIEAQGVVHHIHATIPDEEPKSWFLRAFIRHLQAAEKASIELPGQVNERRAVDATKAR